MVEYKIVQGDYRTIDFSKYYTQCKFSELLCCNCGKGTGAYSWFNRDFIICKNCYSTELSEKQRKGRKGKK